MDIGMLWYDDDKKRTIEEKVNRAANFYQTKYGLQPTECHVHPTVLQAGPVIVGSIRLHASRLVIRNHFWLGIGEQVKT